MKEYDIVFSLEAEEQLASLYRYIEEQKSQDAALRYTNAIADYCHGLQIFPERGTRRDDLAPGLRITHYRKRTAIAFAVTEEEVLIIGIYYGGINYEHLLRTSNVSDMDDE